MDYCENTVKIWRQEAGRSGFRWVINRDGGGEGFIPGAHNASVKGAPKVLLSIFVTDD